MGVWAGGWVGEEWCALYPKAVMGYHSYLIYLLDPSYFLRFAFARVTWRGAKFMVLLVCLLM